MDNILKHTELLIMLVYLMMFLPVIALNLYIQYFFLNIYSIIIVRLFISKERLERMHVIWNFPSIRKIKNTIAFAKRVQEDITDNMPSLPRKTIIMPFQEIIYNLYTELFLNFTKGMLSNKENNSQKIETETQSSNEKTYIKRVYNKIIDIFELFIMFMFVGFINVILCIPLLGLIIFTIINITKYSK